MLTKKKKTLKEVGAVDENGFIDIDTGEIIFSVKYLETLYSLIDNEKKYLDVINSKVRLSLYIDFLFPLALDSTLELFLKEKPEGEMCDDLIEVRKKLWDLIRNNNYNPIEEFKSNNYDTSNMNQGIKLNNNFNQNQNMMIENNQNFVNNNSNFRMEENQKGQNPNINYANNAFRPTPSGERIRQAAASNFF